MEASLTKNVAVTELWNAVSRRNHCYWTEVHTIYMYNCFSDYHVFDYHADAYILILIINKNQIRHRNDYISLSMIMLAISSLVQWLIYYSRIWHEWHMWSYNCQCQCSMWV